MVTATQITDWPGQMTAAIIGGTFAGVLGAVTNLTNDVTLTADQTTLLRGCLGPAIFTYFTANPAPAAWGGAGSGCTAADLQLLFTTNLKDVQLLIAMWVSAHGGGGGGGALAAPVRAQDNGKFKPLSSINTTFGTGAASVVSGNGDIIYFNTHQPLLQMFHNLATVPNYIDSHLCVNLRNYRLQAIVKQFHASAAGQEIVSVLQPIGQWAHGQSIFSQHYTRRPSLGAMKYLHMSLFLLMAAAACVEEAFAASNIPYYKICQLLSTKSTDEIAAMGEKAVEAETNVNQDVEALWYPLHSDYTAPLKFPKTFVPRHQDASFGSAAPNPSVPSVAHRTCNVCGHYHKKLPQSAQATPLKGATDPAAKQMRPEPKFETCPFRNATRMWAIHPDDLAQAETFVDGSALRPPRFVRRPNE